MFIINIVSWVCLCFMPNCCYLKILFSLLYCNAFIFSIYIIWTANQLSSVHVPCQRKHIDLLPSETLHRSICTVTEKTRPPPGQPQQIWQNESGEPVTVKRKDTTHIAFQWAQEADGCMYTRVPLLIQSLGSSAATSVPHQSPFWCISARGIHYDSFKQCRDELHNAMNIDLSICLPIISWFWDNCIAVGSGVWQHVQDSGVVVCHTVCFKNNANASHCESKMDFY